jgi:hypothetical protein
MPAAALDEWIARWRPGLLDAQGRGAGALTRPLGALIYSAQAEHLRRFSASLHALQPSWLAHVATDAQQAVEVLREQAVDLLIVDASLCVEQDLLRLRDLAPAASLLVVGHPPARCERTLQQMQALLAPDGLNEATLGLALDPLAGLAGDPAR